MAEIIGTEFSDFLFGTEDDETILGLAGFDFLFGQGGNDLLDGGADDDSLFGGGGNDVLLGGAGNDSLSGESGFEVVGVDTLTGGDGDDRFEWDLFGRTSTPLIMDIVTDFQGAGVAGGDTLELGSFFFGTLVSFGGALSSVPPLGGSIGTSEDGVVTVFYAHSGGDTLVLADSNDDGLYDDQDFTVRLTGQHNLVESDFGNTDFVIAGTDGPDIINGTAENDRIVALGGDDTVNGLGGDDELNGGDGNDTLNGGDGFDSIGGGDGNDTLNGGADSDVFFGGAGNDTIDGGGGDDLAFGNSGNDVLLGGDGNDTLVGEESFDTAGADTLTGGAGNDGFEWDPFAGKSTPLLTDVVTDFQGAGSAVGDTLELRFFFPPVRFTFGGLVPALPALGSSIGTGADGFVAVSYAFSGGNTIVFADTNDNGTYDGEDFTVRLNGQHNLVQSDFGGVQFIIVGTNGADIINGTEGNETILALGGSDIVNGLGGNDVIEGGDGNDIINGGDGNDRIEGQNGNDIMNGGAGRDSIVGRAGNDIIDGGAGNDPTLSGGDGNDIVRGGDGNDTLDGDDGDDMLFGGTGNDDFFGLDGNDSIFGEAGGDELFGGFGNDILNGGADDDELQGEEGADQITGGGGVDELQFNPGAFQPDSTFGVRDVVHDFEGAGVVGGDVIRLLSGEFAWVGQINAAPTIGAPLPGAGDEISQLGYIRDNANNRTFLIEDTNDDGLLDANDFTVEFVGLHNFTTGDFDNTDFIIAGTNGDDLIFGTEDDDRIFAAGGNDTVFALGGNDEVHGGTGNDDLDSGTGFDFLLGEEGDDTLRLTNTDIGGSAEGGAGNDTLFGSDFSFSFFDNSLRGNEGNDDLHAGAAGSFMGGDSGSDRLFSSERDDQMDGGRDEFTFELDNAQDLFVYTGTGPWSTEGSFFGDQISGFQDGSDMFDMRGSGLVFDDLEIINEEFQTTITSDRGTITIFESFGEEVVITASDFLFV